MYCSQLHWQEVPMGYHCEPIGMRWFTCQHGVSMRGACAKCEQEAIK